MQADQLVAALGACQSPDPAVRKAAEEALNLVRAGRAAGRGPPCHAPPPAAAACRPPCCRPAPCHAAASLRLAPSCCPCPLVQHKHARGQVVNLLRVALEDSVDPAVRQVAAISFKNLVKRDWAAEGACCWGKGPTGDAQCWLAVLPQRGCAKRRFHKAVLSALLPSCCAAFLCHCSRSPLADAPVPLHCAAAAEGKQSPLADEDKAAVREVMLEGVTRAPHAVRVQVRPGGVELWSPLCGARQPVHIARGVASSGATRRRLE